MHIYSDSCVYVCVRVCMGATRKLKSRNPHSLLIVVVVFSGSLIWFYYFYLNYLWLFYIFSVVVVLHAEMFAAFGEYLGNWHEIGISKTVNCNQTPQTSRTSAEFQRVLLEIIYIQTYMCVFWEYNSDTVTISSRKLHFSFYFGFCCNNYLECPSTSSTVVKFQFLFYFSLGVQDRLLYKFLQSGFMFFFCWFKCRFLPVLRPLFNFSSQFCYTVVALLLLNCIVTCKSNFTAAINELHFACVCACRTFFLPRAVIVACRCVYVCVGARLAMTIRSQCLFILIFVVTHATALTVVCTCMRMCVCAHKIIYTKRHSLYVLLQSFGRVPHKTIQTSLKISTRMHTYTYT